MGGGGLCNGPGWHSKQRGTPLLAPCGCWRRVRPSDPLSACQKSGQHAALPPWKPSYRRVARSAPAASLRYPVSRLGVSKGSAADGRQAAAREGSENGAHVARRAKGWQYCLSAGCPPHGCTRCPQRQAAAFGPGWPATQQRGGGSPLLRPTLPLLCGRQAISCTVTPLGHLSPLACKGDPESRKLRV